MRIAQLDLADFSLVHLHSTQDGVQLTPHCKIHGAMNKMTVFEDGGGIWRCISAHSRTKIVNGNSISYKENDSICRAGCQQIKII